MPTASNARAEQLPKAYAAALAVADQEVPDPVPGLFLFPVPEHPSNPAAIGCRQDDSFQGQFVRE